MATPEAPARDGALLFCVLACLITWALSAPGALCLMAHTPPPGPVLAGMGLSAFGPLIAALLTAAPRGQLRSVFRPWRAQPNWLLVALLAPLASHLAATALYVLLGGSPGRWLHPPVSAEQLAALVVFPLGEEFGWRGFLQPRMAARFGHVRGSLGVGLVWALWHLVYCVTPEAGGFDPATALVLLLKLPLWSVIIAWVMLRARGSLAVALAFHVGAHLDNLQRALPFDPRLHGLHVVVLLAAAVLAARSLARVSGARAAGVQLVA